MNISSYLFQSPYSQPFQLGRPDPLMQNEQNREKTEEVQSGQEKEIQYSLAQQNSKTSEEIGIKSNVVYAKSDEFGFTNEQIGKLSDATKNQNQSEYLKIYTQNDTLN